MESTLDLKELVQEYRDALWVLIDRLDNYGRKNAKVRVYARKLELLHKKKHTRGDILDSLKQTILATRPLIDQVYEKQEGYENHRLYEDWSDAPFAVQVETIRLRRILPELGYRGIFRKFDVPVHRSEFNATTSHNEKGFVKRQELVTGVAEEGLQLGAPVSDACADLIAELRAVRRDAPNAFQMESYLHLSHCYDSVAAGQIYAIRYQKKMADVSRRIDRVLEVCGVAEPNPLDFRSGKVEDYVEWRNEEQTRMERLYLELKYLLTLRVV